MSLVRFALYLARRFFAAFYWILFLLFWSWTQGAPL